MALKQDIVLVNEYTAPLPGGGGTRGATPGAYITRYMARELATETLAPIRKSELDGFITRYMAREDAVEALDVATREQLKDRMAQAQGDGGVAFGYGQVSLSDDQLKAAAADVQRLFDEGHTAMKTVLSFDHDYLVRKGLVPAGLKVSRKGDYRGHLDQMKLRMAITAGLDRMGRQFYDDLRWVGVIQVDTRHVHCHLAMVDAGPGRRAKDGTQKGKIPRRAIAQVRRTADAWLDEHSTMAHLSSAVGYERVNVIGYVKRWAHQQALRESLPQFLLATLPADRRLWRLGTNNASMRRPNALMRELVEEVLERPGSPMGRAMAAVQDYAGERRRNEGLSDAEWARLVDTGRERIVERGVNAAYATLRQLPADALIVRTPILDVMGMDYRDLAARAKDDAEDDLVGFSFRLRSYSARLADHTERREEAHEQARRWEAADAAGAAVPGSVAMHRWYLEEEEYHARCASKYRKFLPPLRTTGRWDADLAAVTDYGERLVSLESMRKDSSLARMSDPEEAERLGFEIYGQRGGRLVALGDAASLERLGARAARMRAERERRIEDLRARLSRDGMVLQGQPEGETASVAVGAEHDFEDVKALDMHNMRFDFASDVGVGPRARDAFVSAARSRSRALELAVAYLEGSGQGDAVASLPVADVAAMVALADDLEAEEAPVLRSEVARLSRQRDRERRSRTVRLGSGLADAMTRSVDEEVRAAAATVPEIYASVPEGPREQPE